jgi:MFS family permease
MLLCGMKTSSSSALPVAGLRANWAQFSLLVLVNAFVGGMVGIERSIFPQFAREVFGMESAAAMTSFIAAFGISKAFTNLFSGKMAHRLGRKNLLVLGWVLALPVPPMLLWAPEWSWVVAANVLLGMHQGLTWSSTVVMKIDLAGDKNRGLAMGLNEFAGYLAVAVAAFATSWLAFRYGIKPWPFYLGLAIAIGGLVLSVWAVKDTHAWVRSEALRSGTAPMRGIFAQTTWKNPALRSITQAGMVNNLNDGLMWGLFPVLAVQAGTGVQDLGWMVAIYPAVWGGGQLFTGWISDHFPRRRLIGLGMGIQGLALGVMVWAQHPWHLVLASAGLGLGTALVYPTFLAAIADQAHPEDRAHVLGVFRFWRDAGYALGALGAGLVADRFGLGWAFGGIALLTLASGWVAQR